LLRDQSRAPGGLFSPRARNAVRRASGLFERSGCGLGDDHAETLIRVLTIFGAAAVTFMMLMYALERRGLRFILAFAFAFACLLSSAYGFLVGTWPFGVVEAIWVLIALRRWKATTLANSERLCRGHALIPRPVAIVISPLIGFRRSSRYGAGAFRQPRCSTWSGGVAVREGEYRPRPRPHSRRRSL
jgi:hypothetical protein